MKVFCTLLWCWFFKQVEGYRIAQDNIERSNRKKRKGTILIWNITGRHYEIDDNVKDYVRKKSQRFSKFSSKIVELRVIIEQNRHLFNVEAVMIAGSAKIYAENETSDLYSSIDGTLEKVERQLSRIKEKVQDKHKAMKSKSAETERIGMESAEEEEPEED